MLSDTLFVHCSRSNSTKAFWRETLALCRATCFVSQLLLYHKIFYISHPKEFDSLSLIGLLLKEEICLLYKFAENLEGFFIIITEAFIIFMGCGVILIL